MAVRVVVVGQYDGKSLAAAQRDLDRLKKQAGQAGGPMNKLAGVIRGRLGPSLAIAGAAAGAFAIKLGVDAVKAAAEEEKALNALQQALTNAGDAMAMDQVETFILGMQRTTGVADGELRPAMITLVNATQDATDAQNLLSLALDVSAGSGRDLRTITEALSKAAIGQTTALRRLGVPLSDAAVKSKDLDVITRELSQTFRGQAARAGQTFQGRINRISAALGDMQEALGKGFIDAFGDGEDGVEDLIQAIEDLQPVVEGIGGFIGEQAAGFADLTYLIGQAAGAMGLFGDESGDSAGAMEEHVNVLADFAFGVGGILPMISKMRGQMEEVGIITESAAEQHDDYRDALVRASDAARGAVKDVNELGQETTESAEAAEEAAEKFDLFAAAINKTEQVVDFRQAIDEVGKAFKRTNVPVNIFSEKGKDNFDLLLDLVKETAAYSEAQTTLAGRASVASQGLGELEEAFKNTKMDPGTRALLLEPFQALIADLEEAGVDVTGLQQQLDRLKNKDITITTRFNFPDGRPPGGWPREWYGAKGGMVPNFYASGGMARGMDTVPAMLAPGEFIIRRQAVKQFGADLFSQLNRGINPLAGMTPTGSGRGGGFQIGTINVVSAPGERAETSLPRALRRASFLAGVNG
jgi:hypothetical protein